MNLTPTFAGKQQQHFSMGPHMSDEKYFQIFQNILLELKRRGSHILCLQTTNDFSLEKWRILSRNPIIGTLHGRGQ